MTPLDLVRLPPLMERTGGRPEVIVALIDGPVLMENPDLWSRNVRYLASGQPAKCAVSSSSACTHGTLIASVLSGKRGTSAPALCPDCTLLVRPIFPETTGNAEMPSAKPTHLAEAITDVIEAGAKIVNLSLTLVQPSLEDDGQLEDALNYAAARGVIVATAAGNQNSIGSSVLTRHPWLIPVTACDLAGRPASSTNLGGSIGKWGLCAPGESIASLGPDGSTQPVSGTSAATPFVAGTAALLWSEFPRAKAADIKISLTASRERRRSVVPSLLNAWHAYQTLARSA